MNDKATAKHHWPGPGTTSTQGKRHLRGSLPARHPAQSMLQVPCPRQGSSPITSSKCSVNALPGDPFSREAKELPGELGELEVESLNMVFKHDHIEYPEDSRG